MSDPFPPIAAGSLEAENQSLPFVDRDLYADATALHDAVARCGHDAQAHGLPAFGRAWGTAETAELARLADMHRPVLRPVDPRGRRVDAVEFHPAYHALMRKSMAAGLHAATWDATTEDAAPEPHVVRAARLSLAYGVESGHVCPITMTHAALAALEGEPPLAAIWRAKVCGRAYDPTFTPWWQKSAVTLGMGMTERQGGTDVRANTTQARRTGDAYGIDGHKWFLSAPMSDAFLILAQAPGGLTCFLLPRFRPDGTLNGLRLTRLKDKLGNRSNASSEASFEDAYAQRVGEEGRGIATILAMVQYTRLDCAVASAGLMRAGLAHAMHHTQSRRVFGHTLASQPIMQGVLADLALSVEAATALAIRLAHAFDRAPHDNTEHAYARLMTPVVKYALCKEAPGFLYEAMECLGGNGYVEDWPLARLYREAPVNAIWEGSGNVMALDVLRSAARQPEQTEAVLRRLGEEADAPAFATRLGEALRHTDREGRARAIVAGLASLGAQGALAAGNADVANAHAATRLDAPTGRLYGEAALGSAASVLLERALPR